MNGRTDSTRIDSSAAATSASPIVQIEKTDLSLIFPPLNAASGS